MFNKILLLSALALTIMFGGWAMLYAQDSAESTYISFPVPGSTLSGGITVRVVVSGDSIDTARLYPVSVDGSVYPDIAMDIRRDAFIHWNTLQLPNGEYSLIIEAVTRDGRTLSFAAPNLTLANYATVTPRLGTTVPATPAPVSLFDQPTETPTVSAPDAFPDLFPTPYVPPFTDNTANLPPLEIAYVTENADRDDRYALELYALDGSYGSRLVSEQRRFLDIGWSPDGTRIAYVLNADPNASGALCMVYADTAQWRCFEEYENQGTFERDELSDADYAVNFAWSPDSRQIVYKLRGEAKSDMRIRILDPDSGNIRTIATVDGWFDDPLFWIGDAIYFNGNRISPDGEITVISETLNEANGVWYSPDGRYAIFGRYVRGEGTSLCLHEVASDATLQCFTTVELVSAFGHGRADATHLREVVFSPDLTRVGIIMVRREEEAHWYIYGGDFYGFANDEGSLIPIPFDFDGDQDYVTWHPNNNAVIGGGESAATTGVAVQALNDRFQEGIVHHEEASNTSLVALRPINFRPNSVTVSVNPNVDAQIQLDNGAGVYIPAGSLSGEANVTIEQNPSKALSLLPIASDMTPVSSFYDVRVEGAELVGPVALSFPIDGESLPLPPEATPFFQDENGQAVFPTAEPTPPPVLVMAVPNDEGTAWDYVPLSERPYKGTERVTVWTDTLGDPLIAWHFQSPPLPLCASRMPLMVIPDMVQAGDEATLVGQVLPYASLVDVPIVGEVPLADVSDIAVTVSIMGNVYTTVTNEGGRFALAIPESLTEAMAPQGNYVISRGIRAEAACDADIEHSIDSVAVVPSIGWATLRVAPPGPITPTHTFTPTPTSTATATPQPCEVRANGDVQVRVGPGENRTSVAFMERNVWVPVLGQGGDDNEWWRVEPSIAAPHSLIEQAWVLKEAVERRGSCSGGSVEAQAAPPIVPIRITITPTPSPTGVISEEHTYLVDFTVAPGVITEGQCTMLQWNAPEALSATLDGAPVAISDSMEACPQTDTRYAFTVQLPNGEQSTRVVLVEVLPAEPDALAAPVSINFGATDQTIARGECTTLYWSVEGIDSVYYQGQPTIGQSESRECPTATTSYRLDVRLRTGETVFREVTIYVDAPAAPAPPPVTNEDFPQYTIVWYNASGSWGWDPNIISQSTLVQINGPYYWWDCDEIGNEHARIVHNGQAYIIYSAWRDPSQNDAENNRFRTDAYRLSDYDRICR